MSQVIMGYKLTHDSGFAPNPFHGVLTLATCRPPVRRCRKPGDWVAGFASQQLVARARERGVEIPFMGLVYLARVTEVIPLWRYFADARFALKKPTNDSPHEIERAGDNIYFHDEKRTYHQLPNNHHGPEENAHDLGGVNALICSDFWYLGRKCFVPNGGWSTVLGSQQIGSARLFKLPSDFVQMMLGHFAANGITPRINADPCL
jgi:hypothetical protein